MTSIVNQNQIMYHACSNNWALRKRFFNISIMFAIAAIGLPLLYTAVRSNQKHLHPVEVCIFWAWGTSENGVVQLFTGSSYFLEFFLTYGIIYGVIVIPLYGFMHRHQHEVLTSRFVNESFSPFYSTCAYAITTSLSIIPSAFKNHTPESYGIGFIMVLWGFSLQMFLQPKTDFGLFTCLASSVFAIFTSLVQCKLRNVADYLTFAGFFVIIVLYYYYAKVTWNPVKDDIHIRTRNVKTSEITLRLRQLNENEVSETTLTPNELYHLKQLQNVEGNKIIYQLLPSSSVEPEARIYLSRTDRTRYGYLREYYILTSDDGQQVASASMTTVMLQPSGEEQHEEQLHPGAEAIPQIQRLRMSRSARY